MCEKQKIDLSPLVDESTIQSELTFYDGESDLKSQCLTDEIDCFPKIYDLDALDRLWLMVSYNPIHAKSIT